LGKLPDGVVRLRVEPGERLANGCERVTDRGVRRVGEVDVVRVAGRRWQDDLVQWCPAPERGALVDQRKIEEIDDCAADDEVLLHVSVVGPWRLPAPLGDLRLRDHSSSSAWLRIMFQRSLRGAP